MKTLKHLGLVLILGSAACVSAVAQVAVQCPAFPCTITVTGPPAPPPPPTCNPPSTIVNGVCTAPPPPTAKFVPGDRVVVGTGGVYVRATPSSTGTQLGLQSAGAVGAVVSGPTTDTAGDGLVRWNVNFDTGADGWVVEKTLTKTTPVVVVHGVQLTWTAVAGAVSYSVYRSEVQGGPYGVNTSAPVMTNSYLDPSAISGHTYYYVVRAVNANGESGNSNEVKVVFP